MWLFTTQTEITSCTFICGHAVVHHTSCTTVSQRPKVFALVLKEDPGKL